MTHPASSPPSDQSSTNRPYFQLSSEDYENIWLRINDRVTTKFNWLIGAAFTLGGVLGGIGGYEIARRAVQSEVERYAESGDFRSQLTEATRQQIPALHRDLVALEERAKTLTGTIAIHQQQITALQRPPIEVDPLGARWTAPSGRSLRLQTGRVAVGGLGPAKVTFATPFAVEPVVLVALNEASSPPLTRGAIATTHVTKAGMEIDGNGVSGTVQWVAIGQ